MELSETAVILGKYSQVYRQALTEDLIRVWHDLFANETKEVFLTALRTACKEPGRQFFPTPGEVQAVIKTLKNGQKELGGEVWADIMRYAHNSRSGYDHFSKDYGRNRAAVAALRQIGFERVCHADLETEIPWLRKEFLKAYEDFQERDEQTEHVQIGHEEAKKILASLPVSKLLGN